MPNKRYVNSARRETELQNSLEKEGYYATRASGSHGLADVVAIRPRVCKHCACADVFQVRFFQIKTSQAIKEKKTTIKAEEVPFGYINIEYLYYPVKNEAYRKKFSKKKVKSVRQ